MRVCTRRNALVVCLALVSLTAITAQAQMTATPSSVSAFPTQTTSPITLNLTFPPSAKGGTGSVTVAGLPTGVTTVPSPVTYNAAVGGTSASTSFSFAIASGTTPGTYPITLRDASNGAGGTTVTLVVNTPSFTATASPNPVTLTIGGAAQPVTVSTTPDPGFNGTITYSFSGFPAFVLNDGPKTASPTTAFGPVTFNFSLGTGATAGTYTGALNATGVTGAPLKSFPFTVIVPAPDIAASFTQPVVQICNGQTANDSVQLSPVNGYSGSPTMTFTSVPPGITISALPVVKMPPPATAAFTITANGASSGIATLNISDAAFGINKNIQLQINVVNPDFTAAATPGAITVGAGGAAQNVSASITPNTCLASNVTVTASGMPGGMTVTPNPATIAAPGFAAVSLAVQAAASVFPGTYPVTLSFVSPGAVTKTTTVQVTVQQPDIAASFAQPLLSVCNGQSASDTIQLTPVNGYSGSPSLTFTSVPAGITITPSPLPAVKMPPAASIPITITANGASSGVAVLNVSDPAFGINKTVQLQINVTNPDFTAAMAPLSLSLTAGGSPQNVSASITPNACFATNVNVAATGMPAGMSVAPNPASIAAPGFGPASIAIQAAASTAPGTYPLTFTYTAGALSKTQTVSVTVNAAPDFVLALNPASVTIQAGSSSTTNATITAVNGFTGTANVTAPSSPGVTFTPATFTLTPGSSQSVTIAVASTVARGTRTLAFTATSPGVSGTRSATLSLAINAAPDYTIAVNPGTANVAPGASIAATVTASTLNLFTGVVDVVAPSVPGVTITPSTFQLTPGVSQPISIVVAPTVAPGTLSLVFSSTSPSITGTRTATMILTVTSGADFALAANPPAISAAAGGAVATTTITATALNGFTGSVNVVAPNVVGVTITPASFTITPGGTGQQVSITTASNVAPQVLQLIFSGTSASIPLARTVTVSLTVTNPPGFLLTLAPSSLTIPAGGSATLTASIVPLNGFSGVVTVNAPTVAGLTFSPATFTLTPGATQVVTVNADPNAPAGDRGQQTFTASSPGITSGAGATVALTVSARPDFSITADPPSLSIRSGTTSTVTLSALGVNGFNGPITVTAPAVAGLTFTPATFTFSPGTTQVVTIQAAAAALGHGPLQVTFAATAAPPAGAHGATVVVTVLAPPPILTASAPSAVVAGAQSVVLRVAGDFLQGGAQFHSSDPSLIVEAASVLTAQLADVRVSVRNDAKPGPRDLTATNPDGGVSGPLAILVYPPGAIGAPLDVTAAAIVFPARGTMIAPEEAVYPRGLLATSGTGTIIGSWQFDGVPFDRFVVNATGGMPVEVRTNIALPASFNGSHTITMVIEQPRHFISPAIEILNAVERVSRLTLLAPREGAIIRGTDQTFRWSIVPNCSGYDVEVALPGTGNLPDALTPMAKFHVADAEWHPSAADVASIGPGVHRWRIRPRCAGETDLQPSAWQRFAILPEHVNITMLPTTTNEHGARVVRWNSGVTGLLYHVEFLSPDGQVIFSALTSATEYTLPQSLPAGTTVRVSAVGPGGKVLGTSPSSPMSRRSGRESIFLVQQPAIVEILAVEPAEGSAVNTAQPHIAAQWKGAAKPEEVTLLVDNTDITQVATVTPTSIAYDSLIALAPGNHDVALAVAGNVKRWSFTVAPPPGEAAAAAAAAPAPAAEPRGDWVIAPVGTVTLIRGENHEGRTQFSALTDLNGAGLSNKATGDMSLRHDFDKGDTVQESRNWAGEVGAHQGESVKERLRFGYVPPDFLDQAQFLTAALPRGGIQASLALPHGTASYYQTFSSTPAGLATGLFGPSQKIRAAAYTLPVTEKWDFRVFGLRVQEGATQTTAGGTGHAVGVFGRYTLGATVNAIVEAAHGDFKPGQGSDETTRKGNAFRVALNGMRGTVTYAANVRKTDSDFVNPANRGFTPGGVPDRTAADVMVGKSIGTTALSVQLRHQFDGSTSGLTVPRTRESGGTASVTTMLGQHVSVALSGNLTKDKGDGNEELSMPRSDRTQSGQTATFSEFFGVYNFSQTVTRQLMRDHVNDNNDNTVTSATLAGGGQLTPWFNLSTALSSTKSAGSAMVGTTSQYLASLQPMIMIPRLFLSFQPRASFSTSKSDLIDQKTTSEQYAALVTFGPTWFNQVVALQLSADWNRSKVSGQPAPGFTHRYVGTINLHWRAGYGPAYTSGVMPPGVAQMAAPNPSASAPGAK